MTCDNFDTVFLTLGSTRNVSHDVTEAIAADDTVASVSSITDVTDDGVSTGELTIANKAASTVAYTDQKTGVTVAIGKAIQFTISTSSTVAATYKLKIVYTTTNSPAETVVDYLFVTFE